MLMQEKRSAEKGRGGRWGDGDEGGKRRKDGKREGEEIFRVLEFFCGRKRERGGRGGEWGGGGEGFSVGWGFANCWGSFWSSDHFLIVEINNELMEIRECEVI